MREMRFGVSLTGLGRFQEVVGGWWEYTGQRLKTGRSGCADVFESAEQVYCG